MLKQTTIALTLMFAAFTSQAFNNGFHIYKDPIGIQPYVKDPAKVIKDAINLRHWTVKEEKPNVVTIWLENYSGFQVIVDVHYNEKVIWFDLVSHRKLDCKKGPCPVSEPKLERWRHALRNHILIEINRLLLASNINDVTFDGLKEVREAQKISN